jgi:hypothetical protein
MGVQADMGQKNWTIKDAGTGDVVFSVKGKDMSVKVEKGEFTGVWQRDLQLIGAVFTDAKGQDVLKLRRHNAWKYGDYYVEDMDNKEVVTIERRTPSPTSRLVSTQR